MLDTPNRPKVGVAVFIKKDGKYIFYKRHGSHGAETWSIPGGHLEFGESWAEAAARETLEEVGVTIKNIQFVAATNDVFPEIGKHYVSIWLKADLDEGEPTSQEPDKVVDVQWHAMDDLPSPLFEPCWQNLRAAKPELFA